MLFDVNKVPPTSVEILKERARLVEMENSGFMDRDRIKEGIATWGVSGMLMATLGVLLLIEGGVHGDQTLINILLVTVGLCVAMVYRLKKRRAACAASLASLDAAILELEVADSTSLDNLCKWYLELTPVKIYLDQVDRMGRVPVVGEYKAIQEWMRQSCHIFS